MQVHGAKFTRPPLSNPTPPLAALDAHRGLIMVVMAIDHASYFIARSHSLGRAALFFYLFHLWIYGVLGLLFKSGCGLTTMYLFWLLGLVVLYPVCSLYNRFKQRTPLDSIWRFL